MSFNEIFTWSIQEHGTKKQVCEAPHPTNDEESHATPQV